MKKQLNALLLTCMLLLGAASLHAQTVAQQPTEKTRRFLLKYMADIDTSTMLSKDEILKGIEMVASASKADWISQYQAAFYNAILGVNKTDTVLAAKMMNKATAYINAADSLRKNESEIVLLSAMIKGMRIKLNPSLGEKMGPEVMSEYEKAKKLNPENPRVWLVLGESFTYMPEEAGGGNKKAKKYLDTAMSKFEKDKHDDPAWPTWGKERAAKLLSELEKK